jgi:N-acetylneuraminate synthase
MTRLHIGGRAISSSDPTYFIADISANHDGDLERAKALIHLAREAGADAAKFQNFTAAKIVSQEGFASLQGQLSHQAKWKQSVYEVYAGASIPSAWTPILKLECDKAGIEYFSTPYDFDALDMLDSYVRVYKIGSGDITWPEMIERVARKQRPVLIAAGASTIGDVQRAMDILLQHAVDVVLMQCNTNYTASRDNFRYIQLNVLRTFAAMYPGVILGLSDHTPGHATVLGAVALGARVIEKHFTDDTAREGPDHPFSMDPQSWRDMVDRTRELELALGSGDKRVEDNERDTVIVQRRCVRAAEAIPGGTVLGRAHLDVLRPAPADAILPSDISRVLGLRTRADLPKGRELRWTDLETVPPCG